MIPKNPSDVFGYVYCDLVSPFIDLTFNDDDKLEFEIRGDRGVWVYLLYIGGSKREWVVPEITLASDGYKKWSYDLEVDQVFTTNKKKRKLMQTRKARVIISVWVFAKDFVIGQKWSPTEIRNIVTPPL